MSDQRYGNKDVTLVDESGNVASIAGGGLLSIPIPSASQTGLSTDRQTGLTNTAVAVKASSGRLYGYNIFNPGTALAYVHFYDVASGSVTVGTTTPKLSIALPSNANASIGDDVQFTIPITFATAITIAASTTPGGGTAPGTALVANTYYV